MEAGPQGGYVAAFAIEAWTHHAGGSEKAFIISLSMAACVSDMPLTALGQWRCGIVDVFMYGLMHGPKGRRIPFFGFGGTFGIIFYQSDLINIVPVIYTTRLIPGGPSNMQVDLYFYQDLYKLYRLPYTLFYVRAALDIFCKCQLING